MYLEDIAISVEHHADRAMRLRYHPALKSTSGKMGGVIIVIVKEVGTPEPRQNRSLG